MLRRTLLALGLSAMAAPALAQSRRGWRTLFNGRNLDAFTPRGDANWRIEDGLAVSDSGGGGFLVSNETFGDFELRAEFWVDPVANSGIFIRATNPFTIGTNSGYEVNIYDTRPDPTYGTGGIVDVAKVDPMPKAGGRWNVMRIRAVGDTFDVWLNDARTVMGAKDKRFAHGRIALQRGAGVVKWRKVEVRSL